SPARGLLAARPQASSVAGAGAGSARGVVAASAGGAVAASGAVGPDDDARPGRRVPIATAARANAATGTHSAVWNARSPASGPVASPSARTLTAVAAERPDRKSTRLNSSHVKSSYARF